MYYLRRVATRRFWYGESMKEKFIEAGEIVNTHGVRGETEHLIPAVDEFILSTDADAGVITVRLIEGM